MEILEPANHEPVDALLVRNPFDPAHSLERRTLDFHPGWSVAEYLTVIAPADEYVVSVNGGAVRIEDRPETFLEPGDQLVVCPVVEGGGGGKNIFRIIGIVVVMILAAITQQYWAEGVLWAGLATEGGMLASSTAAMVAGSVVAIGGSMLVSALTASPPPRLPDISGMGDSSATYGWDGPKTLAMQGVPIPILYGTMKISGNVIARHVTMDGDTQYLTLVLALA